LTDLLRGHLATLRINSLAEWDSLAFIYRHGTSLASPEQIAQLLGYNSSVIGAALDSLASTGLIERSRNTHGLRVYRLAVAVPGDPRQRALEELISVAEERRARLVLIRLLQQAATSKDRRESGGLHLA
jgi:DNA-binding MarR family transcriptional regulator